MIKKITSFFSSDFESVFAYHLTGKTLSFVFYPKAVYFECNFWISRSVIIHVQTDRLDLRGLDPEGFSVRMQLIIYAKREFKSLKDQTPRAAY